ncbi:YadA-like family protein [Basilea psittacipulmonis]|uniref:Autotransporter domain-containing protein n=1 Tax=Basilea psittacipulmonis DSM 24701 TaxID=1072685 RepID=A0A077DDI2_9BURK|nr:YadA-like family protein [Basilea psittacipulmonis]AIL32930.1 hypothetical protein IX83_06030 [Basilea psittacipulmonis DSM 24701]
MNKVYKTKYSRERNCIVVVSELSTNRGKSSEKNSKSLKRPSFRGLLLSIALGLSLIPGWSVAAGCYPSGTGTLVVVSGNIRSNIGNEATAADSPYKDLTDPNKPYKRSVFLNPTGTSTSSYTIESPCLVSTQSVVIGADAANAVVTNVSGGYNITQYNRGVVLGFNAKSYATNSVVFGHNAKAEDTAVGIPKGSIAFGASSKAREQAVVVGQNSGADQQSLAIGSDTYASGVSAIAIGNDDLGGGLYADRLGASLLTRVSDILVGGSYMTLSNFNSLYNRAGSYQYSPTLAAGTGAIAVGGRTLALGKASTAIGSLAFAFADEATAVGLRSFVASTAKGGSAIGNEAWVFAPNSVSVGNFTEASNSGAVAYGYRSRAIATDSVAMGTLVLSGAKFKTSSISVNTLKQSYASLARNTSNNDDSYYQAIDNATNAISRSDIEQDTSNVYLTIYNSDGTENKKITKGQTANGVKNTVALGSHAYALGTNAMTLGYAVMVEGSNTLAFGSYSYASPNANNSVLMGVASYSDADKTLVMGNKARSFGSESIAIGVNASVSKERSIAIGVNAQSTETGSIAVGESAVAQARDSLAIGSSSRATSVNSVALGYRSATTYYYDPSDISRATLSGTSALDLAPYVAQGSTFDLGTDEAAGFVSVGGWSSGDSKQPVGVRRVINVAPGALDTDVATVGQLTALSSVNRVSNMVYYVEENGKKQQVIYSEGKYYPVDEAGHITSKAVDYIASRVKIGVRNDASAQVYNGGSGTNTYRGLALGTALTLGNVSEGEISTTSNDAINGSQIKRVVDTLGLEVDEAKTGFAPINAIFKNANGASTQADNITLVDLIGKTINHLNQGLVFSDGSTDSQQYLGSSLTIKGDGRNMKTTVSASKNVATLNIGLSDKPSFTTVGINGITLASSEPGKLTVSSNNGEYKLTGLANATTSSQAVTGSQLAAYSTTLKTKGNSGEGTVTLKDTTGLILGTDDRGLLSVNYESVSDPTGAKTYAVSVRPSDKLTAIINSLPEHFSRIVENAADADLGNITSTGEANIQKIITDNVNWQIATTGTSSTTRQLTSEGRLDLVAGSGMSVDMTTAENKARYTITTNDSAVRYVSVNETTKGSNEDNSGAKGQQSIAIGVNAIANATNSVALGSGSQADREAANIIAPYGNVDLTGKTLGAVSVGATGSERQVTQVASAVSQTDAINFAQLKSQEDSIAQALGVSLDENGQVKAADIGGTGKSTITEAIQQIHQSAKDSLVNVKGDGNYIKVTDNGDGSFTVTGKDWTSEIANKQAEAKTAFQTAKNLTYQANGANAQTTSLSKGLTFDVNDQNLTVKSEEGGKISYALNSEGLTGITSISGLTQHTPDASDYATDPTRAATRSAIQTVKNEIDKSWSIKGDSGTVAPTLVSNGATVTFENGNLTNTVVDATDRVVTVSAKVATLTTDESGNVILSGTEDGLVTADTLKNVLNTAVNDISSDASTKQTQQLASYAKKDASGINVSAWNEKLGGLTFSGDTGSVQKTLGADTALTITGSSLDQNALTALTDENIGVVASDQTLTVQLSKNLKGLDNVASDQLVLTGGTVKNITLSSPESNTLKLSSGQSDAVVIHNVANATNSNDVINLSQAKQALGGNIASFLGDGVTTDAEGNLIVDNFAGTGQTTIGDAINSVYQEATKKVKVAGGNQLEVKVSESDENTYIVKGTDWNEQINKLKLDIQNQFQQNSLTYVAQGEDQTKTTTLATGLIFGVNPSGADDSSKNLTVSAEANGVVRYSLKSQLKDVSSIVLSSNARANVTDSTYGSQSVATESAVKSVYTTINQGWFIKSSNETQTNKVVPGTQVAFVDGNALKANVTQTQEGATVSYDVNTTTLTVNGKTVTADTQGTSDTPVLVTAGDVAKAITEAVSAIDENANTALSGLKLNYAANEGEGSISLTDLNAKLTLQGDGNIITKADGSNIEISLKSDLKTKIDHLPTTLDDALSAKVGVNAEGIHQEKWQETLGKIRYTADGNTATHQQLGQSLKISGHPDSDKTFSEGNIGVVADQDSLAIKLSKNLAGLESVASTTMALGNSSNSALQLSDNDGLQLGNGNDLVTVSGVADAVNATDLVNASQLKAMTKSIADALGNGVTVGSDGMSLTVNNYGDQTGTKTVSELIRTIYQNAKAKTELVAGEHVSVTYDDNTRTYTISDHDWSTEINDAKQDLANHFDQQSLNVTVAGTSKDVMLNSALNFVDGKNTSVTVGENGQITYTLNSTLTGITSIDGLNSTTNVTDSSYGINGNENKVATEADVQAIYNEAVTKGWKIAPDTGDAITVSAGHTVNFSDGTGTKAKVTKSGTDVSVSYDVNVQNVQFDPERGSVVTDNTTGAADSTFATAEDTAQAITEAIKKAKGDRENAYADLTLHYKADNNKEATYENAKSMVLNKDTLTIAGATDANGQAKSILATGDANGNIVLSFGDKATSLQNIPDNVTEKINNLANANASNINSTLENWRDVLGGITFTGDIGSTTQKLNSTIKVTGGSNALSTSDTDNIKVTASQGKLNIQLAKDVKGLGALGTQTVALGSGTDNITLKTSDNSLVLGDGDFVKLTNIAAGNVSDDTALINYSQLDQVKGDMATIVGVSKKTDGTLDTDQFAGTNANNINDAIEEVYESAKQKTIIKAGDNVTVTSDANDPDTYLVETKDWTSTINDTLNKRLQNFKHDATLAYKVSTDDEEKTTTLSEGLVFDTSETPNTTDNNLNVTVDSTGISYDLASDLKGIQSVSGLENRTSATSADYGEDDRLATRGAVKEAYDLASKGWNIQGSHGTSKSAGTIHSGKTVTVEDGNYTTVTLTPNNTDGHIVTYTVKKGQLTVNDSTVTADKDGLVTAKDVIDATKQLIEQASSTSSGNLDSELVNYVKTDASNIDADKWRDALGSFTFVTDEGSLVKALTQEIAFSGGASDLSSGQNIGVIASSGDTLTVKLASTLSNLKDVQANSFKVGNIQLEKTPDGALKLSDANGGPIKITNLADATDPSSAINMKQLRELQALVGRDSSTVTAEQMGPVATQDGLNGLNGKRTSSLSDQVLALRDGTSGSVVYTDSNGQRLVKEGENYYHLQENGSKGDQVDTSNIVISAVNATGTTTDDIVISNIASGIGRKSNTLNAPISTEEARQLMAGSDKDGQGGLLTATHFNQAVNTGDLQALAIAGLSFVDHQDQAVNRALGTTLNLLGGADLGTATAANNIVVDANSDNQTILIKLADQLTGLDTISSTQQFNLGTSDDKISLSSDKGTLKLTGNDGSSTVTLNNIADAQNVTDLINRQNFDDVKKLVVGSDTPETPAEHSAAGKDGLNGQSASQQILALRQGLGGTVVYTDSEGNRLSKVGEKFYKATEVNQGVPISGASEVADDKVVLSAVATDGTTITPETLSNVATALGISTGDQPLTVDEVTQAVTLLLTMTDEDFDQLVSLADLKAVATSGLNFTGNDTTTTVPVTLGGDLSIQGEGTVTGDTATNNLYVKADDKNLTIQLSKDLTGLSSVTSESYQVGSPDEHIDLTVLDDGALKLADENGEPVEIKGIAEGKEEGDAINVSQYEVVRKQIKGDDTNSNLAGQNISAKDGQDGRSGNLITSLRNGLAGNIVYTAPDGERLVKIGDDYYRPSDTENSQLKDGKTSGDAIAKDQIILSAVNTDGQTTTPILLRNIASGLGLPTTGKPISENDAKQAIAGTNGLLSMSDSDLTKVATVADLQALAQAGMDFNGNTGSVHRMLGTALAVRGYVAAGETMTELDDDHTADGNIVVTKDAQAERSLLIALSKELENLNSASFKNTQDDGSLSEVTVTKEGIQLATTPSDQTDSTKGPSLTVQGLDNAGKRLQNVKMSDDPNSVANLEYLDKQVADLTQTYDQLEEQAGTLTKQIKDVKDAQDTGWTVKVAQVDDGKVHYQGTVTNNGEVINPANSVLTLKEGKGIKLSADATTNTVTISANQESLLNDVVANKNFPAHFVVEQDDGSLIPVYKVGDTYNTQADGSGTKVDDVAVKVALKDPMQLTNVANGIEHVVATSTDPADVIQAARQTVAGSNLDGTSGLLGSSGDDLNKAVNIADLQAVAQSGLTISADESVGSSGVTEKTFALGSTIRIKGDPNIGDSAIDESEYSADNILTEMDQDGNLIIKLADNMTGTDLTAEESITVGNKTEKGNIPTGGTVTIVHDKGSDSNSTDDNSGSIVIHGSNGQDGVVISSDKTTGAGSIVLKGDDQNATIHLTSSGIMIDPSDADPTLNVSLTDAGLNNGGNRIQNVGNALAETDVVNMKQLQAMQNNYETAIKDLQKEVRANVASALASTNLQSSVHPGTSTIAMGAANYRGENAMAVGFSRLSKTGKVAMRVTGAVNSNGDLSTSVGVTFRW